MNWSHVRAFSLSLQISVTARIRIPNFAYSFCFQIIYGYTFTNIIIHFVKVNREIYYVYSCNFLRVKSNLDLTPMSSSGDIHHASLSVSTSDPSSVQSHGSVGPARVSPTHALTRVFSDHVLYSLNISRVGNSAWIESMVDVTFSSQIKSVNGLDWNIRQHGKKW